MIPALKSRFLALSGITDPGYNDTVPPLDNGPALQRWDNRSEGK
jgi:hypothetical protein